jgi:hypothetical protein
MLNKNSSEFREWLKGRLHDGSEDVLVTFTKKDGSERVMRCTLAESRIPSEHAPKSEGTTKKNDDSLAVYDVEKSGWRSFRWESLTGVDVEAAS